MRNRNELRDVIMLVLILIVLFTALIWAMTHETVCAEEPEPEQVRISLTIPEQERVRIDAEAVDNFIEEEAVRSSTGPSEPHRGIPEGIDPEDRDLVERIVMAEAGVEPYPGIIAVAQVILDQSREWGISVRETCTVPGRFTTPYAGDVSDRVRTAVHEVFDLGVRVTDEPITHFHNPTVDPYWAHTLTFVTQIGGHLFYH